MLTKQRQTTRKRASHQSVAAVGAIALTVVTLFLLLPLTPTLLCAQSTADTTHWLTLNQLEQSTPHTASLYYANPANAPLVHSQSTICNHTTVGVGVATMDGATTSALGQNPSLYRPNGTMPTASYSNHMTQGTAANHPLQEGEGWRGWSAWGSTWLHPTSRKTSHTTPKVTSPTPEWTAWCNARHLNGTRQNSWASLTSDHSVVGCMGAMTVNNNQTETQTGSQTSSESDIAPLKVDTRREQYDFGTGFGWCSGRTTLGLDISYTSASEWCEHDPRPKNETLRAQAMVGAAVQLGSLSNADTQEDREQSNRAPRLDIGLLAHKYSQESNIKFLNALGASTVIYELEGLGSHYTRFSGDYDTRRFKGHLFGGQMGAMWQTGHRSAVPAQWTATVSLGKRQIDKSLDDAGNATIDNTESKIMQAELTYQGGLTCHYWAQLMWTRQTDALTRHVYDMGTSGYREISTQQKWEGTNNIIALRFRALHQDDAWGHTLGGSIAIDMSKQEQTADAKELKANIFTQQIEGSAWHNGTLLRLKAQAAIRHSGAIGDKSMSVGNNTLPQAWTTETESLDLQTANLVGISLGLRGDWALGRLKEGKLKTLYAQLSWGHDWRSGNILHNGNMMSCHVGITL